MKVLITIVVASMLYGQEIPRANIPADLLIARAQHLQDRGKHDSAIVLFDSASLLYSETNNLGGWVKSAIGTAASLKAKGNYDKALDALRFDSAIISSLENIVPLIAAQRLITLGSVYRQLGMYDSALSLANTALDVQYRAAMDTTLLADTYTLFAGTYFDFGEHDSALEYNHRILRLLSPSNLKVSGTLNSIAGIHDSHGEYDTAIEFYMRALAMRKEAFGEKHPDIANLYNNIAAVYFRSGDHDRALEFYFTSLSIMRETLDPDNPAFAVRYNNIAMAYRAQQNFASAIAYSDSSRRRFTAKLGANHPNVAGVTNNIGRIYSDMNRHSDALNAYNEALDIWKTKLGPKHPNVLQCYFNIGEAHGKLGDVDSAIRWLNLSLTLRSETLGEKNVKTAQSHAALGAVYAATRQTDSALACYQRALIALVDDFSDHNVFVNPRIEKSHSPVDLLAVLTEKGWVLSQKADNEHSTQLHQASLSTYKLSAQLIELIRRELKAEGSKLLFSKLSFRVYDEGIAAALRLHALTKQREYLSAAFALVERSKAGILRDALSESDAKKFSGIPDSLLAQESALRKKMAVTETEMQQEREKREKANAKRIHQYESGLFDLRRTHERLIAELERTYPEYFSLKYHTDPITLRSVQRSLPAGTALLEYFVGSGTTTLFVVTKNGIQTRKLNVSSDLLSSYVRRFRLAIQKVEDGELMTLGQELYARLVAPAETILTGINRLFIVPDGSLHYLPFEALITGTSPPKQINLAKYMIEDFAISYHPSAHFISNASFAQSKAGREKSFAGIAPVFSEQPPHYDAVHASSVQRPTLSRTINGERFQELKETENEVRNIHALFAEQRHPARMFLHGDAKESLLKSSSASQYRYVHIASHGIINEEHPKLSGIIFAAPNQSSLDDGILYSGEIYNLTLRADLVTLSACETGLGTIAQGEGILGLTRGFLYAGAKNLVVSLWQVGDKSTAVLMTELYRNILNGESYASALRSAKIAMIRGGTYHHPVEWSPFILTGK